MHHQQLTAGQSTTKARGLTVGQRLATIPLLFLLGAGCLLCLMQLKVSSIAKNSPTTNLAGRQRTLNQVFTREINDRIDGIQSDHAGTKSREISPK